jgi:hypothetical protein
MPQEFKVKNGLIVDQGGATITGSVIATGGFTGSLQGTASYAIQALSASFAPQTPTFPFTGSAIISGSLVVTGSLIIKSGSSELINTRTYTIRDQNASESIMWGNNARILLDNNNLSSVQWGDRFLVNNDGTSYTVNWQSLHLNDNNYILSADWGNRVLYDTNTSSSVDWENRSLLTRNGAYAFDYSTSNDSVAYSQLYIANSTSGTTQKALTDTSIYSGHIIQGTVDASTTAYDIVYLDTDGTWKSLKNLPTVSTKMLGIEVEGNILIEGDITVSDDGSVGTYVVNADHGLPVYLSTTTGRLTTTQPSSGVIRVVGHIYYQNPVSTNVWLMKFRPSNDWYEI